jgi:hypothetical protein
MISQTVHGSDPDNVEVMKIDKVVDAAGEYRCREALLVTRQGVSTETAASVHDRLLVGALL